jgi:hypothetical protein
MEHTEHPKLPNALAKLSNTPDSRVSVVSLLIPGLTGSCGLLAAALCSDRQRQKEKEREREER